MRFRVPIIDREVRPLWSEFRITLLALLLGCLLGADILLGSIVAQAELTSCHNIAHLYVVVQQSGKRGLVTLGKRGSAGFSYYQSHPAELQVARAQLERQIHDFTPPACGISLAP